MIRLDSISKQNGHQIVFIEASAALQKGEKIGLVGPNGAGKTTLFRMIAGQEQPDEGQIAVDRGVTIGYFSQDVGEMAGRSAVAEVMDGAGPVSAVAAELKDLETAMTDPERADEMEAILERYGEVQARFQDLDGYALEARAREVLAGLGFSQETMEGDVGALSGGWKMRVALARILLMRPDAMLLDEPSNHLDLESLIWLEQFLNGYDGALLMTSHDREFMNRIVGKIVEIDGGTLTTYSGDYDFYEQQRALSEKQQQAQFERQQAMLEKEIRFIERFKARASHAAQVQSRVKKLEKIDRVEPPRRRQSVLFDFPPAPRSGEDVATLSAVRKAYGSRSIYDGLDFQVRRRERWCVLGVNGAGKSTLLGLIAGTVQPTSGRVKRGKTVKVATLTQRMDELDPHLDEPVRVVVGRLRTTYQFGTGSKAQELTPGQLLERMGFSSAQLSTPVRDLSGGQKRRLQLLLILLDQPNVLILDEPTNDLDTDMLAAIEELLDAWAGTLLVVSHDRYFMERVTDQQYAVMNGHLRHLPGGVDEYLRLRRAQQSAATADGGASAAGAGRGGATATGSSELSGAERRAAHKELQTVERRIAKLTAQADADRTALADHDQSDYVGLGDKMKAINAIDAEITALEERWLELSELLD